MPVMLPLGQFLGKEKMESHMWFIMQARLNEVHRNYKTIEKELLAILYALDKFIAYLVGSFIVIFTDHSALK